MARIAEARARGCFVTGTDTGIGKTIVAAALVRTLADHGIRVAGMKPVASGAQRTAEGLRNDDARVLAAAATVRAPYSDVNPYCFEPAISPHIAAEDAGVTIDLQVIRRAYGRLAARAQCVVVEGAGGWLAPLSDSVSMADLAAGLGLPVILVVGMRLGCLNHARLTVEAIRSRGVAFAGWIANAVEPQYERAPENLAMLTRLLGSEPLDELTFDPTHAAALRIAPEKLRLVPALAQLSF